MRCELAGFKVVGTTPRNMSKATKIVLATVGLSALFSLALVANVIA